MSNYPDDFKGKHRDSVEYKCTHCEDVKHWWVEGTSDTIFFEPYQIEDEKCPNCDKVGVPA